MLSQFSQKRPLCVQRPPTFHAMRWMKVSGQSCTTAAHHAALTAVVFPRLAYLFSAYSRKCSTVASCLFINIMTKRE